MIVAPIISVAWGVSKASFSPVFAAGLLGMALGALLFGALADRFGRKAIIVVCFVAFGVLTIAKAYATSITSLTILQFLAGLGVGGATPRRCACCWWAGSLRREDGRWRRNWRHCQA